MVIFHSYVKLPEGIWGSPPTCQGWIGGTPQPHQRNSGAHFGPDMNESRKPFVDMGSDLGERDYMVEGFWRVHAPDFIFGEYGGLNPHFHELMPSIGCIGPLPHILAD